jgi:hypothetical protein
LAKTRIERRHGQHKLERGYDAALPRSFGRLNGRQRQQALAHVVRIKAEYETSYTCPKDRAAGGATSVSEPGWPLAGASATPNPCGATIQNVSFSTCSLMFLFDLFLFDLSFTSKLPYVEARSGRLF